MHILAAADAAPAALDYLTYGTAIVAGIGGGAAAAWITGRANFTLARAQRRDEASRALWAYHRALLGVANTEFGNAQVSIDWMQPVVTAGMNEVMEAQRAAHEYATFLPAEKQHLVRSASIDEANPMTPEPEDSLVFAESANKLAAELERALVAEFGNEGKRRRSRGATGE